MKQVRSQDFQFPLQRELHPILSTNVRVCVQPRSSPTLHRSPRPSIPHTLTSDDPTPSKILSLWTHRPTKIQWWIVATTLPSMLSSPQLRTFPKPPRHVPLLAISETDPSWANRKHCLDQSHGENNVAGDEIPPNGTSYSRVSPPIDPNRDPDPTISQYPKPRIHTLTHFFFDLIKEAVRIFCSSPFSSRLFSYLLLSLCCWNGRRRYGFFCKQQRCQHLPTE